MTLFNIVQQLMRVASAALAVQGELVTEKDRSSSNLGTAAPEYRFSCGAAQI